MNLACALSLFRVPLEMTNSSGQSMFPKALQAVLMEAGCVYSGGYPDGHILSTCAESMGSPNKDCFARTKKVNAWSRISLLGPPGSNCALAIKN